MALNVWFTSWVCWQKRCKSTTKKAIKRRKIVGEENRVDIIKSLTFDSEDERNDSRSASTDTSVMPISHSITGWDPIPYIDYPNYYSYYPFYNQSSYASQDMPLLTLLLTTVIKHQQHQLFSRLVVTHALMFIVLVDNY